MTIEMRISADIGSESSVPGTLDVPGNSAARDITLSFTRFARRLRGEGGGPSISLAELAVLDALAHEGPLTPRELAERERVRPTSMSRAVAALHMQGLIGRVPHRTDGRQTVIVLSEAGRRMLSEEDAARELWLQDRLDGLDERDRATLAATAAILERLQPYSQRTDYSWVP